VAELVEDGVTGLLASEGDAAGIASALEKLLKNGELRARMSLAARRTAEAKFSVERHVDKLLALWSEILDGAG
jgi:glycosyltransferase involved in cell wall biosynthesis